MRLRA
jgi:sensor domain CHASE-containing protein